MNCHDNKNSNNKAHSPIKQILCCAAPILIAAVLPFLSLNSGLRTVIAGITPFICPIMMFLMMPMMLKGMGRDASHDDKIRADKTVIGENKDENMIK